jgi:hypothetical protein
MPTLALSVEYKTEQERAALEQAVAFVTEMHQLAQSAPDGQVLALCEARALDQGRRLLRDTLQAAAQARTDAAEQKGAPPAPVRAPAATTSRGGTSAT